MTIGLTEGEQHAEENERLATEPIYLGLAQLIGLLLAVDGGFIDGTE
ncbi:MAG: hypothetical protein ACOC2V_07035 [Alkalispirochaeta sp.]